MRLREEIRLYVGILLLVQALTMIAAASSRRILPPRYRAATSPMLCPISALGETP